MSNKKNFALGYSLVANWSIAWIIAPFSLSIGTNIFRNSLCEMFDMSPAPMLTMSTIIGVIGALVFFFVPKIINKIGAKGFIVIAALISGLAWIAAPMVNNTLWVSIMYGITKTAPIMLALGGTMVQVSKWFPRKKAVIMGLITSSGIIASVVVLPIYTKLIASAGPRNAALVIGLFIIAYGVASIFWIKETPQEVGLLPDNMPLTDDMLATEGVTICTRRQVITSPRWWCGTIGWGLTLLGVEGFLSIAITYMIGRGIPQPTAIVFVSICGVIQFVTSNLSGIADHKIGNPVKVSVVINGMQIIGLLICAFYTGPSWAIIAISYWLVVGTFGASNNLFSSHMFNLAGAQNYSVAFSLFNLFFFLIKAFGTQVSAFSLNQTGGYVLSYQLFAVALIVGLILICIAGNKIAIKNDNLVI